MSSTAPGSEGPSTAAAAPLGPPGPRLLVLLRHGESEWNKANRFTGWVDVDITEQGKRQATRAGALMRAHLGHGDRAFDVAFTSVLRRAIRTLHMAEDVMELLHLEEVGACGLACGLAVLHSSQLVWGSASLSEGMADWQT